MKLAKPHAQNLQKKKALELTLMIVAKFLRQQFIFLAFLEDFSCMFVLIAFSSVMMYDEVQIILPDFCLQILENASKKVEFFHKKQK